MKLAHHILVIFLACTSISFAQNEVNISLIARNTGEKILADETTIRVFGFAETLSQQPGVPGPTIIANEGDSVHIDLWNVSQGAPHTIHLHGLDVDQQNDGVPHLSFEVPHMGHGYYHFKAPHAGTYLYHCHVASTIHVQAGMYGLIKILPPDGSNTTWDGGYAYDDEHSYFLSEIDSTWHRDSVLMHEHDTSLTVHPVTIPEYHPQFFLINGFSDGQLVDEEETFNSSMNQVDFIRLANIGYCGNRVIFPEELNAKIISSDGRPLNNVEVSDTVYLYPGERYGVLAESTVEFESQIQFDYIDLNTMEVKNSQFVPVSVSGTVGVEEIPSELLYFKIVPNPSNQEARLDFELLSDANVQTRIYDVSGRLIWQSEKEQLGQGQHQLEVGNHITTSGIYTIQIEVDGKGFASRKFVRL